MAQWFLQNKRQTEDFYNSNDSGAFIFYCADVIGIKRKN